MQFVIHQVREAGYLVGVPSGCWYYDLLHGLLFYTHTVDGKHDVSSSLCNNVQISMESYATYGKRS